MALSFFGQRTDLGQSSVSAGIESHTADGHERAWGGFRSSGDSHTEISLHATETADWNQRGPRTTTSSFTADSGSGTLRGEGGALEPTLTGTPRSEATGAGSRYRSDSPFFYGDPLQPQSDHGQENELIEVSYRPQGDQSGGFRGENKSSYEKSLKENRLIPNGVSSLESSEKSTTTSGTKGDADNPTTFRDDQYERIDGGSEKTTTDQTAANDPSIAELVATHEKTWNVEERSKSHAERTGDDAKLNSSWSYKSGSSDKWTDRGQAKTGMSTPLYWKEWDIAGGSEDSVTQASSYNGKSKLDSQDRLVSGSFLATESKKEERSSYGSSVPTRGKGFVTEGDFGTEDLSPTGEPIFRVEPGTTYRDDFTSESTSESSALEVGGVHRTSAGLVTDGFFITSANQSTSSLDKISVDWPTYFGRLKSDLTDRDKDGSSVWIVGVYNNEGLKETVNAKTSGSGSLEIISTYRGETSRYYQEDQPQSTNSGYQGTAPPAGAGTFSEDIGPTDQQLGLRKVTAADIAEMTERMRKQRELNGGDASEGDSWWWAGTKTGLAEGVSIGADFVPIVGQLKAGYEAYTGVGLFTGEELGTVERVGSAASLVPGGAIAKKAWGALSKYLKGGAESTLSRGFKASNIADEVAQQADEAAADGAEAVAKQVDEAPPRGPDVDSPQPDTDIELAEPTKVDAPRSYSATLGKATSTNFKGTFFKSNPALEGEVVVHHAVEQQVLTKYPGVITEAELHSLENLRGIPKSINSDVHLSKIRIEWNKFYKQFDLNGSVPTRQQLLDKATEIDKLFGSQFTPPAGE